MPTTNWQDLTNASGRAEKLTPELARQLGRECYQASTNWINSGRRAKWNDSLRAFQSLHPSGSKYLSLDYKYRSRHFVPKTRSMVRRAEAQNAAAFFSNEDVVSITASDDDDPKQQASSEIMKRLLQYRLTKTIPWFLTVQGARQDCEVMGVAIGKAYWKYQERFSHTETVPSFDDRGVPIFGENGMQQSEDQDVFTKVEDHPWIDLIPSENFRFDPGADWRNPIATSPYLIELIPMYVHDVRAKVRSGEWLRVSESSIMAANDLDDDVTRRSREQQRIPGKDHDAWKPREFDISWVRSNIIRWGGQDWHFYSLASAGELLTLPRPLKEVFLHGERPYVVGFVVVESHKTYPSAKVELIDGLQRITNDIVNLRQDNVKLALQPRQFVDAGAGWELQDVRTFMPGKTMVGKKPTETIHWDRPPEVTGSSFDEQDRINVDLDELAGTFSPSTMASGQNPVVPETVGGMEHMAAPSVSLNEYELRTFAETFVEPLLRQVVKLEQAYETDPVVLAMAGQQAQLFQKFGMDQITDDLLNQELTVRVNVGVGSTNPALKLKNFMTGAQILGQIFGPTAAQGANFQEVAKEVFAMCGFKDGARFFQPQFDPRVQMLQNQVNQLMGKQKTPQGNQPMDPAEVGLKQAEAAHDYAKTQYQAQYDQGRLQNERRKIGVEEQYKMGDLALRAQQLGLDRQKMHVDMNQQHQQMLMSHHQRMAQAMQPRPAAPQGANAGVP